MTLRRLSDLYHGHETAAAIIAVAALISVLPIVVSLWFRQAQGESILAAIWTTITAWGCVTTLWTLHDCWRERAAKVEAGETDRALELIANGNVRRETIRAAVLFGLLYIGVSVLVGQTNPIVARLVLIGVALLLTINSILDRLERRETDREIRASRANKEYTG